MRAEPIKHWLARIGHERRRQISARLLSPLSALLALQLIFAAFASAADDSSSQQACVEMQDKVPAEQELKCYREAAQAQQTQDQLKAPPSVAMQGKTLAEEWAPAAGVPLKIYKQNYFLVTHTSQPNDTPTTPNPQNQAPFTYPLDHKEVKFQISIKNELINFGRHTIWGGYSQQSFWQVFNTNHSTPVRETDYEPEVIYSYRPNGWGSASTMVNSFLNAALVHQSNGQSRPRSRAWNRLYVQAGFEHDFGDNGRVALLPRYWKRIWADSTDDDNADIVDYLGHGDLELRYYRGHGMLSAIARSRSLQVDLALPLRIFDIENSNLHLQYFHGYGESLIDYNQSHTTYGIGFSVPFVDSY